MSKMTSKEFAEVLGSGFAAITEAIVEVTPAFASESGFVALEVANINETHVLWHTPEQDKFLRARYDVDADYVTFSEVGVVEVDDDEFEGVKEQYARVLECLENGDRDGAEKAFDQILEVRVCRIVDGKPRCWTQKPGLHQKLSRAMRRARRTNRASYLRAANSPRTKYRRMISMQRNRQTGAARRLRMYRINTAFDALANAARGAVMMLPESLRHDVVSGGKFVPSCDREQDLIFAQRRLAVKTGKCGIFQFARDRDVTLGEHAASYAPDYTKMRRDIMEGRRLVENEHRKVWFRERAEALRQLIEAQDQEAASAAAKGIALERPELVYLTKAELSRQLECVFESTRVVGDANTAAALIDAALVAEHRARVSLLINAALPLFSENEQIEYETQDEAVDQIRQRIVAAINEEAEAVKQTQKALLDALQALVAAVRGEVSEFADDDEDKESLTGISDVLNGHAETLKRALDGGEPLSHADAAEILGDIVEIVEGLSDDDDGGDEEEPTEDPEATEPSGEDADGEDADGEDADGEDTDAAAAVVATAKTENEANLSLEQMLFDEQGVYSLWEADDLGEITAENVDDMLVRARRAGVTPEQYAASMRVVVDGLNEDDPRVDEFNRVVRLIESRAAYCRA